MKYVNLVLITTSLCLLTACLEVEDDSNSDVAQAIQAQNEILSGTNPTTAENSTVALTGLIVNAVDNTEVSAANITVIAADVVIQENLVFTGGEFKIENLPSSSDITLIISSSDNRFLSRTFFMNTGYSNSVNTPNDYGTLIVSEATDVQVTVMNNTTGLPLPTLEFIAYSHSGNSSRANKYKHVSVYDAVNGVYNITLPKFINTGIRANLDLNGDGEVDFIPESNNLQDNDLYYPSANKQESLTIYVEDKMPLAEVEYRITLIDESANTILGADLTVTGSDGEKSTSTYDELTEQYVLSAKFANSSTIEIPSFTANDVVYRSSSVQLNLDDIETLTVYVSGTSGNNYYNIPYSNVVELAVMPRVLDNGSSALEVIAVANKVDFVDHSFSVFYSQPITVSASSLSLTNTSGFTVIKGNDDSNDIVLAGTTIVSGNVDIPVTFETSLNDTKLTVTPVSTLTSGQDYNYEVNSLAVKATDKLVDVNGDSLSFSIEDNSDTFDINDIRLDNNNYKTNGVIITPTNSAGDSSSPYNYNRDAYLYLPTSINALQTLSLRSVSITQDGVNSNSIRDFNLVKNGNPYNAYAIGLVQLAENETLIRDNLNISIEIGSAQLDSQKVYRTSTNEYMSDNLVGSENSITFEYAYETKAGVVATGTLTIPVQ
ncbi:hypothetical protein [Colwellia sp. Bg11-12]|uniref:hypothetical protein n=1 Tax=Colwellia sp. Bg11-12 TaxID=2759817 RepID=UPI0015F6AC62|nr:hypothetical protein [Colwellia sp. Bg11-12]MBA6264897.1 hypothetical protein [Colwellia sp. Bg11-12]